jgi:hypothetical protein
MQLLMLALTALFASLVPCYIPRLIRSLRESVLLHALTLPPALKVQPCCMR